MPSEALHRFEFNGKRFAIDPETCFCFECDEICWDVLEYYPLATVNAIFHHLGGKHSRKELSEVVGELEWLRSCKSILLRPTAEDLKKEFEVDRGLRRLVVGLPRADAETRAERSWFGRRGAGPSLPDREFAREAVALLLNRSLQQQELTIEFLEDGGIAHPGLIGESCAQALRMARLAGKQLTAAVRIGGLNLEGLPEGLAGHALSVRLEFRDPECIEDRLRPFAGSGPRSLSRLAKAVLALGDGASGCVIVRPDHPAFGGAAAALAEAGFKNIELDLDGSYVVHPDLDPGEMLRGLGESAVYYARALLGGNYFRLEPMAGLFRRIYDGLPTRRVDPIGLNELAITSDGGIYPSWRLTDRPEFRHGDLTSASVDEPALARYEDVGVVTTSACRGCWARHLCGGGCAAVHHALSGSYRRPHPPWCDAQRSWMTSAVSAFNVLSAEGVNFTRLHESLVRPASGKFSMFQMVRAAMGMSVRMRPIEESDAEMLVRWENWNESAYFLFNESGMFMATRYDREMDSLHPQGMDREMMLLRRNGEPIGLFKFRPDRVAGAAQAWLYLRKPADYASRDIAKGIRFLMKEASGQQSLRRITVPAADHETGLQGLLESVGMAREGTLREALYLHGAYRDVHIYGTGVDSL